MSSYDVAQYGHMHLKPQSQLAFFQMLFMLPAFVHLPFQLIRSVDLNRYMKSDRGPVNVVKYRNSTPTKESDRCKDLQASKRPVQRDA